MALALGRLALALALVGGTPTHAPTPASAQATGTQATAQAAFRSRVVHSARSLRGTPYRWGGTTRRGFDCSGYTRYAYARAGVRIPRVSRDQARRSRRIPARSARPGDLVFFTNGARVYHVAIYAGHRRVWHSPRPGGRVRLERIWTRKIWFGRYYHQR